MAESCSVFGCKSTKSDTVSLHVLPKDPGTRAKWIQFIWRARAVPAKIPDKIRVCSHHFSDDSFVNFTQKLMGFASKLILNPYAVPSFYLGDNTTS
uniref:THAP domain-containing protein 1 n=1 Tax=Mola mola TaxID=94237 RepID=A0A3Q3XLR3_MOLML